MAVCLSLGGVLSTPGMSAPVGSSPRGTGIEEDVMPKKYARLQINEHEAELIMVSGPIFSFFVPMYA